MKNMRWMILGTLGVVLALGVAWISLQEPPLTESTSPVISEQLDPIPSPDKNQNEDPNTTETDTQPTSENETQAPDPNTEEGVEVLYGELVSEINVVEFQLYCVKNEGCNTPQSFILLGLSPSNISLNNEGQRLDYWLLNHFSQASVSIVETWFAENRIAVNDQLVGQTYKLRQDDLIALQVTEFSALRVVMTDYLKQSNRVEYDLIEISMAPAAKLKQSGIFAKRYLAVGKLFNQDIHNVNLETLSDLKDSLMPWKDWQFVGTFGPYRLFELD